MSVQNIVVERVDVVRRAWSRAVQGLEFSRIQKRLRHADNIQAVVHQVHVESQSRNIGRAVERGLIKAVLALHHKVLPPTVL